MRVRYRYEWVAEVPDGQIEPGTPVGLESVELVARSVTFSLEERARRVGAFWPPGLPEWERERLGHLPADVDAFVVLADRLIEPGARWLVDCKLSGRGDTVDESGRNASHSGALAPLVAETDSLDEALDAILEWARARKAAGLRGIEGGPARLGGWANLGVEEPDGDRRWVLNVSFARAGDYASVDEVLAALEALEIEAERLFGQGKGPDEPSGRAPTLEAPSPEPQGPAATARRRPRLGGPQFDAARGRYHSIPPRLRELRERPAGDEPDEPGS